MSDTGYKPPAVWTWDSESGGKFASINRPTSGATHDKELPRGEHPHQLYSLATPNGVKVTLMFEELLEAGHSAAEYDAWLIKIGDGDQFGSGFVAANPNSKIPALLDYSEDAANPVRVFESASILFYLAEKFGKFLPTDRAARTETMNWLFWQMGSAPYLGGGFGHFYAYAPFAQEYPINRFAMEVKRQMHVLDTRLGETQYVAGADYSIADMAIAPWYGLLTTGKIYSGDGFDSARFLSVHEYKNVIRWYEAVSTRPAYQRGRMVNRMAGDPSEQLHERHSANDFETRTQDKLAAAE